MGGYNIYALLNLLQDVNELTGPTCTVPMKQSDVNGKIICRADDKAHGRQFEGYTTRIVAAKPTATSMELIDAPKTRTDRMDKTRTVKEVTMLRSYSHFCRLMIRQPGFRRNWFRLSSDRRSVFVNATVIYFSSLYDYRFVGGGRTA